MAVHVQLSGAMASTKHLFKPTTLFSCSFDMYNYWNVFFICFFRKQKRWVRFGNDLELLDSPGIILMRFSDQSAAIKVAICDDMGERSYDAADVAGILVQMLSRLPTLGGRALCDRYKIDVEGQSGKVFVPKFAVPLFNGDTHQAAFWILSDFRKGKFGWVALERPPM